MSINYEEAGIMFECLKLVNLVIFVVPRFVFFISLFA